MNEMRISSNGIKALKGSEGLKLKAYQDQKGVWTIGYGHTGKVGNKPVGAGMTITNEQAEELFRQRLPEFENAVRSSVKVPITQNQYDVLVSLAYNIGPNGLRKSSVIEKLNKGDTIGAANELLEYNKVTNPETKRKEFNKGVFNRRVREREMFLGGEKIDAQMPENQIPIYDNLKAVPNFNTPNTEELAQAFTPPTPNQGEPNPFNELNQTLADYTEPQVQKPHYRKQYQNQLAAAFGVTPEMQGGLPDYIGDLVRSIYDQTA